MRFGILGPLDIRDDDGSALDPGGQRPRTLLTLLLLEAGRTVPAERLLDGLYGDAPPAGAANALQSQISRLRKRLDVAIEAGPAGYRLAADPEDVDAHRFERLAREGRRTLTAGAHAEAANVLRAALALWRGPALPDLAGSRAARYEELRLAAHQDRVEADLALGGGPELVPELRELIAGHPLSERLYGQLMRALRTAGRPADALAVYEEARRTLADELGADPSPELAALHLELLQGTSDTAPRGVPAQLTRFVGRAEELARIAGLLRTERLVTLTGPGGAGKTRLAVEAAGRHAPDKAPVAYVELAPLADGAQVPYAILTALGVREGARHPAGDAHERLVSALEGRELLLVLDNCEHLVEEAALLTGRLLGACPGLRVLATSREALGITGEAQCPVPPLPPRTAEQLFADRAAAVRPDIELHARVNGDAGPPGSADGHARVAEICAALDGLPLAIELAAARLRTLTLDELANRLDDRFRLLSRGDRTKAPRHRTLRAVVEWSWELLDEEERELARRFTVFAGGADLGAVEEVCEVPYPDDLLASLAEKSFLEVTDGRYRMLETIRAFCAQQLTEAGETDRLGAAHAAYFLRLATEAEPFLRGHEQLHWLARLATEHGNLDAALRHLVAASPEDALRLVAALSWYGRLRGGYGALAPHARALFAAVGGEPPAGLEEEFVLCVVNTFTGGGSDPREQERLARARPVMEALEWPLRLPFTMVLWSVAAGPRHIDDALLRTARHDGDPWAPALIELGRGFQEWFAGRPEESEASFTRAVTGFRAAGDRWGMANSLDPLGVFAFWRGDSERALRLLDEALVHVRELEAPEETADLLHRKATVLLHAGRPVEAESHFTRACRYARTAGVIDKEAGALRGLGDTARMAGDTARARDRYEAALATCSDNWFSVGESVRILIGLGRTALAEGAPDEARDWFAQARTLADDAPLELAEAAEALASVEPPEQAARLLGAAAGLRGTELLGDLDVARTRAAVRAELSPAAYKTAFELGRTAATIN